MKTLFCLSALLSLSLATSASAAKAPCAYVLDQEDYAEKASGKLTYKNQSYRCEDTRIGKDSHTLCQKAGARGKGFDLLMSFDGAEADFFVFDSLAPDAEPLCHGNATNL
ncbi:MAG: hypothetical protein EOP11_15220 [Proteobacteria bacterium]|nr:MAG: hypothetical protein EOP11_15220 [Pseudomonadota bacterium]